MNYMKQVAQLFGVELGEEFKIEKEDKYKFTEDTEDRYKFTKECLMVLLTDGKWYTAPLVLYKLLNGRYKLIKLTKPVLDNVEKKYLSYVIKPFREDVLKIAKFKSNNLENKEVIGIKTQDGNTIFPAFEKGKMYKNMELNKDYSLKELGL